jgi:hypothetical protein
VPSAFQTLWAFFASIGACMLLYVIVTIIDNHANKPPDPPESTSSPS